MKYTHKIIIVTIFLLSTVISWAQTTPPPPPGGGPPGFPINETIFLLLGLGAMYGVFKKK